MKTILRCIMAFQLLAGAILPALDAAPRWGFLGDDKALTATFESAENVVLVCIFDTELRNVKPPFAEVVYHATIIESHKGELKIGEKIRISFPTDSLPAGEDERRKFLDNANSKNKGALRFAFLHEGADGNYSCEWCDVPQYQREMLEFLRELQRRPADKSQATGDDDLPPEISGQPNHGLTSRIEITGRQFAPGMPIPVSYTVRNLAPTPTRIWHSGFWPNHQIRVCDQNGRLAALSAFGQERFNAFSPGGERMKNSPEDIEPGGVDKSESQNIARLYDLSAPGIYSVQVLYEEYQGGWEGQLWSNVIIIQIIAPDAHP